MCLMSVWTFFSCEDFMDIHKDYLEGGEIIYAPKPDTVSFVAGKERILFKCRTYNAVNVQSIDLYWNGRQDSLIIPVEQKNGYDSISVVLENMAEKSYTFDVRTTDNFGHKSLFVTGFGTAYGKNFELGLVPRMIQSLSLSDEGGVINWHVAPEHLVRSEVRYTKKDGSEAVSCVSSGDIVLTLPDVKLGSSIDYRSLFLPEEEAIDTFPTPWKTYKTLFPTEYKFQTDDWEVIAASDESSDHGGKTTILDGKLETFWHSAWETGAAPLPHWVVIDMQSPRKISRIEIYRRTNNTDTKSVELFVSDQPVADTNDWKKIGGGTFIEGDLLSVPMSTSVETGRYLKLLLPDSNNEPHTSIAEIYLYGES